MSIGKQYQPVILSPFSLKTIKFIPISCNKRHYVRKLHQTNHRDYSSYYDDGDETENEEKKNHDSNHKNNSHNNNSHNKFIQTTKKQKSASCSACVKIIEDKIKLCSKHCDPDQTLKQIKLLHYQTWNTDQVIINIVEETYPKVFKNQKFDIESIARAVHKMENYGSS
jgi:hypothetical protein